MKTNATFQYANHWAEQSPDGFLTNNVTSLQKGGECYLEQTGNTRQITGMDGMSSYKYDYNMYVTPEFQDRIHLGTVIKAKLDNGIEYIGRVTSIEVYNKAIILCLS